MKRKITSITVAVLFVVSAAITKGCGILTEHTETRKADGMTTTEYVSEDGKEYMTIITEDGLHWDLENFRATPFAVCSVTFDTKGTENMEDDTVLSVNVYTNFDKGGSQ